MTENSNPEDGSVLSGAILIFMDELEAKEGQMFVAVRSNAVKKNFYTLSESDCSERRLLGNRD